MLSTTPSLPALIAGKYKVITLLGRGGMGKVYKAMHTGLGREVALKVLHAELNSDPDFVKRFLREARAMGRLNHENIIRVYDVFEDHGVYYIAMEFFEAYPLQQWIKQYSKQHAKPELAQAVHIIAQVARGLVYAHEQGVVHRDIKPQNIFVNSHGLAKIGDFGIASTTDDSLLTTTGQLFGSPRYMPPEQASGKTTDPRSDIYSLAMVCYELLSGKNPFDNKMAIAIVGELVYQQNELDLDFPPNVPQELQDLIRASLSKDPACRQQTTAEFAAALEKCHENIIRNQGRVNLAGTAEKTRQDVPETQTPHAIGRHNDTMPAKGNNRLLLKLAGVLLFAAISGVYFWGDTGILDRFIPNSFTQSHTKTVLEVNRDFQDFHRMSVSVREVRASAEKVKAGQWAAESFNSASALYSEAEERITLAQTLIEQQSYDKAKTAISAAKQFLSDAKRLFGAARTEALSRIEQNTISGKLTELEALKRRIQQRKVMAEQEGVKTYESSMFAAAENKLERADELLRQARESQKSDPAITLSRLQESARSYLASADLLDDALAGAREKALAKQAENKYAAWKNALSELEASRRSAEKAEARRYAPQTYQQAVKLWDEITASRTRIDKAIQAGDHQKALKAMDSGIARSEGVRLEYAKLLAKAEAAKKSRLAKIAKTVEPPKVALAKAALPMVSQPKVSQPKVAQPAKSAKPTQKDIDIVERLLYDFEHAYENKNMDLLKMITDMSVNRLASVREAFAKYQTIDITINGYSVSGKQATAEIEINRLIGPDGTDETQPAWRTSRLLIHKGVNGWQRITWE